MAGSRSIHLYALAFFAGILIVQQTGELPTVWWLLVPGVTLLRFCRWRWTWPWLAGLLGASWAIWRAGLILDPSLPVSLEGRDVLVEGSVCSLPHHAQRYLNFDLCVETLADGDLRHAPPGRVRLRHYGAGTVVRAGERWRFKVRLKRPHGFQNPGGFDYEGWLFRQRIRATGYVRDDPGNRLLGKRLFSLHAAREALRGRIQAVLPEQSHRGLLIALALGDRSEVGRAAREILQRTGTSHLIAISGLHIGLVAGLAYTVGVLLWRWCGTAPRRLAAPKAGAVMGLLAGIAYAGLAGFSIPTQRALIMLALFMGGVLLGRGTQVWRLFSLAALAVLIWDPFAAMDPSFWLSFGAVTVLLYLLVGRANVGAAWRRWIGTQTRLSLGLSPIIIAVFQVVSLTAPIANCIAIPVFAFAVVPATLLGCLALVSGWETGAALLLKAAGSALTLTWWLLDRLAHSDLSVWSPPVSSGAAILCALIAVWFLLAPGGLPARWLGLVWLLPLWFSAPSNLRSGEFKMTVLDVGQGLSIAVQTANQTIVYDTGARFGPDYDLGQVVLVPFLRSAGIHDVDTLVISHGDNDHIGGLPSLLKSISVKQRLTSVPRQVVGGVPCVPGASWTADDVTFKILSPLVAQPLPHNNSSCVIRIVGRYGSALLTGDIEAETEAMLVQRYRVELRSDILVIPHQGSQTSSTHAFVDAVRPRYAIVSAGYMNPYGHPHRAVMARYRQFGVTVYNTAQAGAVSLEVTKNRLLIDGYRTSNARFWFKKDQP